MSAKTKSERLKRLLANGYFAPELPPCFTSENLGRFREFISDGIDNLPKLKGKTPNYQKFKSEISCFYFPRFGKEDRKHGVPNPIAHLLLSRVLADHYVALRRIARASKLTLSPPIFDWLGSRALFRSSVELRDEFRVKLSSRREEYVAADVRAFFHSIYTHAIPWAIHGKDFAKQHRGMLHYGNLIDLLCRNAQDGQTVGLAVGPDTSRLIAEVVASAMDVHLQKRLGIGAHDASRYIDDYTLSSPNDVSSEELHAALRQSAAIFELELNNEKFSINKTSHRHNTGWQQAVRAHILRSLLSSGLIKTSALEHFLYQLGGMCLAHPDINIEKFGIQNARSALVNAEKWSTIQFFLINAYRRNSSLISLMVEIFLLRQVNYGDVQNKDIEEFVEDRVATLARENRTGEIVWFLFLSIRLNITISSKKIDSLYSIENAFIALLVVCLDHRGLVRGSVNRALWDQSLTAAGLRSPMWLYAYELSRKVLLLERMTTSLCKIHILVCCGKNAFSS